MAPRKFSPELIAAAESINLTDDLFSGRRTVSGITIDPTNAPDLDDAIHVEKTSAGYIVSVSVADADALVPKNSLLDHEARKRSFSIYRNSGTSPMLPERLSNDLLSLLPHQRRLTKTITIELNENLDIVGTRLERTLLTSSYRYDYASASREIRKPGSELAIWHDLALRLAKKRNKKVDEDKGLYINDDGKEVSISFGHAPAYILIEELMILANNATALEAQNRGLDFIYRNHKVSEKRGKPAHVFYSATPNIHTGLKLEEYTHFTSPIRRYADLICHRIVTAYLMGEQPPYNRHEVRQIAREINELNRKNTEEQKHRKYATYNHFIDVAGKEQLGNLGIRLFSKILIFALRYRPDAHHVFEAALANPALLSEQAKCRVLLSETKADLMNLKSAVLESISEAPIQMLGMAKEKSPMIVWDYRFDSKPYNREYASRAVVNIRGQEYITEGFATASGEKKARAEAAKLFWHDFIHGKIIKLENSLPIQSPIIEVTKPLKESAQTTSTESSDRVGSTAMKKDKTFTLNTIISTHSLERNLEHQPTPDGKIKATLTVSGSGLEGRSVTAIGIGDTDDEATKWATHYMLTRQCIKALKQITPFPQTETGTSRD